MKLTNTKEGLKSGQKGDPAKKCITGHRGGKPTKKKPYGVQREEAVEVEMSEGQTWQKPAE